MNYWPIVAFLLLAAGISLRWPLSPWLLLAYLLVSLFAFLVYARDKHAAKRGGWRTPESTLLMLAILGGWPGSIVAQQLLRHKSHKPSFRLKFWLAVSLNQALFLLTTTPLLNRPTP